MDSNVTEVKNFTGLKISYRVEPAGMAGFILQLLFETQAVRTYFVNEQLAASHSPSGDYETYIPLKPGTYILRVKQNIQGNLTGGKSFGVFQENYRFEIKKNRIVVFISGIPGNPLPQGFEGIPNWSKIEKDHERLSVKFTEEEAQGLTRVVNDVRKLLNGNAMENLQESNLQERLINLEKEWKKREGAWIVVKHLEAIRIKSRLYIANAQFLQRLTEKDNMYEKVKGRMEAYLAGIYASNDALEDTVGKSPYYRSHL